MRASAREPIHTSHKYRLDASVQGVIRFTCQVTPFRYGVLGVFEILLGTWPRLLAYQAVNSNSWVTL